MNRGIDHLFLKDCLCSEKNNLVMYLANEAFTERWIECDFCGNKTNKYETDEIAEFKWNEFQYKRTEGIFWNEGGSINITWVFYLLLIIWLYIFFDIAMDYMTIDQFIQVEK